MKSFFLATTIRHKNILVGQLRVKMLGEVMLNLQVIVSYQY